MAMRFQKHPSRYEGNRAGCILGLIGIFDFRHDQSTRRLLAGRRRSGKQVAGSQHLGIQTTSEIHDNVVVALEHKTITADAAKTSVKELMEEEMINEQRSENQSNCSDIDFEKIDSKYEKNKTHHKSRDMDVSEKFDKVPEQKPLDDSDLEIIMQELAKSPKIKQESNAGHTLTVLEEKLATAVDLFIEQKLSKSKHFGEEEKSCWSKGFMDAQQKLSSKRGLFLKLLQEPNSLLVKHMQDLEDAQLGKDRTCCSSPSYKSEENQKDLKLDKFSSRRHRNFFHRRSKSLSSYRVRGDKDCQSSSKIVVLKPGSAGPESPRTDLDFSSISLQSHYKTSNKMHNERTISQFSFKGIKQKLRQAIAKQKQGISPNRNHFCTESFAKSSTSFKKGKAEQVGKSRDSDSAVVNRACQHGKLEVSNIYIEAKRHLSEMLNNGDENVETMTRPMSESLGRILSLPDNSGSSCCSPGKHSDDSFTTALMKLSPRSSVENDMDGFLQESHSNPEDGVQFVDINVSIPFNGDKECSSGIQSITKYTITPEVSSSSSEVEEIQETTGLRPQVKENTTNTCSKSSSSLITGDTKNGDNRELDNEESASQCSKDSSLCSKLDLCEEVQISSSPPVPPTCFERVNDRMERASPVSVLEPLFTYDDISPPSTISHPVAKEIQPQHIQFEEQSPASNQGVCMTISLDNEESAFEYVEAILLGSGLNWDEFLVRWISLNEILDESLFHEVELFSGRPRYDQKLLFDCANEVLKEVCESYFRSCRKHNIQPALTSVDIINEVWERVEYHLFVHPILHSLDQLIKIDMARCGKWINLHSDIELISFEMEESIFDELVQDTLLSFVESMKEYQYAVLQDESDAIVDMTYNRV